jgi:UDP-glucose 4-epimerase
MENSNKHILVTGGAGYIGSHTVVALIEAGYQPVIVDDFRNAQEDVIDRLEKITGRTTPCERISCHETEKLASIIEKYAIDGVIHFAADKAVGESVENPLKYFDNNLGGLISVLKAMKAKKVNRLVFSSSCTVYGIPETIPVEENGAVSYNSPYGFTKLVNEQMLEQFAAAEEHFKTVLLRYFNPVGAHPSGWIGEEPQGVPSNLLPFITQTAAGMRKELIVHGNDYDTSDGTCVRDYIHVVDLAEAHVAALNFMESEKSQSLETINIGTGTGTSVKEMIDTFQDVCGVPLNWKFGPRRQGDVPKIFANADSAKNKLNWEARFSVKDALSSAWNYQQKRLKNSV